MIPNISRYPATINPNTSVKRITQLVPRQKPQNCGPRFRKGSSMARQTEGESSLTTDRPNQEYTDGPSPRQRGDLVVESSARRCLSHSPKASSRQDSRVRPSTARIPLTFLSKGALRKTVTRFRGPDRPCRRPRLTCRFARGFGILLRPGISVVPPSPFVGPPAPSHSPSP